MTDEVWPFNQSINQSINQSSIDGADSLTMAKPHRTFFVMAGVNANAVKRSNALNGYGSALTYCEGRAFPTFYAALLSVINLAVY